MNVTLLRYRGIPLRLHGSFLLLGGLYVLWQLVSVGLSAAVFAAVFAALLFGSVLLHELGHAMMARRFGIRTRAITLYPFGGVASLEREPRNPTEELLVALAGPAVNVVLALVALPGVALGVPGASLFLGMNVVMAVFNLLPAFPMDGGRVLRAWLARREGYVRATARALQIGRWFAWGMVALGLFGNPSLLLVGGFLLLAISGERQRLAHVVSGRLPQGYSGPAPRRVRWEPPSQRVIHSDTWNHPAV
ncbi:MAG: site-2 protease family protein [Alphaproteobacteria bacterium]|nr:site-2 protease family protein [Alphaproteobacteria bacterium]